MELSIKERMTLFGMLPASGDIVTVKALRELRESISISEEIKKEIGYNVKTGKVDGKDVSWTTFDVEKAKKLDEKNGMLDVMIPGVITALIVEILNEHANAKPKPTLRDEHIELWDKFVEGKV